MKINQYVYENAIENLFEKFESDTYTQKEFVEDCIFLMRVLKKYYDINSTSFEVATIWEWYSDRYDAGWMADFPGDLEDLSKKNTKWTREVIGMFIKEFS